MKLTAALLFTAISLPTWSQNPVGTSDFLERRLGLLSEACHGRPEELDRLGRKMLADSANRASCDSLLLGYTLRLKAYNLSPQRFESPQWDSTRCAYRGNTLLNEEGTRNFIARRYKEARNWYLRALDNTQDPKRRASIMQSIGTCYYRENDLERAVEWYSNSTQYGVELLSAISLSNLANAHLALGHPEECMRWAKSAEKKLLDDLDEGLDPNQFLLNRDLILGNICLAALEMGEFKEAEAAFQRMGLKEILPGLGPEFFHTAWVISWQLNDPYLLAKHESQWSRVLLEDSIGAVKRFGPALCLLEPWRSQCTAAGRAAEMGDVWALLRELPAEQLPELSLTTVTEEERRSDWRNWAAWPWLGGFWFLMGAGVWGRERLRLRRQRSRSWTLSEALGFLQSGVCSSEGTERRKGRMGLAYLVHQLQLGPWVEPLTALSRRELAVLFALALGERPKDTANRLGISTKTVYMVRTDLRKKLGLDAEGPLETWLSDRWKLASPPKQGAWVLPLLVVPTDLFQQLEEGMDQPGVVYPPSDFVALPAADLPVFHAAVVAFALGSLAWTMVAWKKWGGRRRLRPFAVLDAYLQGPLEDVRSEEAIAQVQVLEHLVGMQDKAILHRAGIWNVLTTAERLVVQGILADKTVQEMAKDLACTTSHVYNLRASIRRKWELDPEQPMRAAIKQHLREE